MSINFCTLDASSVDSFCGNVRAKVLANLIVEKYGVVPYGSSSGAIIKPGVIAHQYHQYRQPDKWVPPVISTELDRIRVTVHVQAENFHGQDEQAVRPDQSVVVVSNLKFEGSTIDVNITDLKFN